MVLNRYIHVFRPHLGLHSIPSSALNLRLLHSKDQPKTYHLDFDYIYPSFKYGMS